MGGDNIQECNCFPVMSPQLTNRWSREVEATKRKHTRGTLLRFALFVLNLKFENPTYKFALSFDRINKKDQNHTSQYSPVDLLGDRRPAKS